MAVPTVFDTEFVLPRVNIVFLFFKFILFKGYIRRPGHVDSTRLRGALSLYL